jgi:hypothetical protein
MNGNKLLQLIKPKIFHFHHRLLGETREGYTEQILRLFLGCKLGEMLRLRTVLREFPKITPPHQGKEGRKAGPARRSHARENHVLADFCAHH